MKIYVVMNTFFICHVPIYYLQFSLKEIHNLNLLLLIEFIAIDSTV